MRDKVEELEEAEGDEQFEFPPPELKINTQPYDLSVHTLLEQWEDKLLGIPEIQREYVWDNGRASRLIESLILNIPVPPLYFAETDDARFEVIDGHQRVRSIARYLSNEFALSGLGVLAEFKGMRFFQLPEREQRFLKTRSLRVVIITHESHPSMKFEVFERLNTGGISLNAQELRNSLYRGTFNRELKSLAKNEAFRTCIGTRAPRRRMVDEELVLRFFPLRDTHAAYKPPLKRVLNDCMDAHRDPDDDWLAERRQIFVDTMSVVASVLGEQSFRLIDKEGNPLRDDRGKPLPRGVNRALFDAQAIAFSWVEELNLQDARAEIVQRISEALTVEATQDAVRRATGDRKRIFHRVKAMVDVLEAAQVPLNVPIDLDIDEQYAERCPQVAPRWNRRGTRPSAGKPHSTWGASGPPACSQSHQSR